MPKMRRNNAGAIVLTASVVCLVLILLLSVMRANFLQQQAQLEEKSPVPERVVFLGTTGVSWDLLNRTQAPNLFAAANLPNTKVANFVVKVKADTACPDEGWLTLNTGVRSLGLAAEDEYCRALGQVERDGAQWQIANWADYREANTENKYAPQFGNLMQAFSTTGLQVAAIGDGAALALADTTGKLSSQVRYLPVIDQNIALSTGKQQIASAGSVDAQLRAAINAVGNAQVIVADLGVLRTDFSPLISANPTVHVDRENELNGKDTADSQKDSRSRTALGASFHIPDPPSMQLRNDLAQLDARFAAVVETLQSQDAQLAQTTGQIPHTRVIFASLAESDRTAAKMQAYLEFALADLAGSANSFSVEKATAKSQLAYTNSTRIPGVVQNTDLLPTLVSFSQSVVDASWQSEVTAKLGNAVGAPIGQYLRDTKGADAVDYVLNQGERAKYMRASLGYAFTGFAVISVAGAIFAMVLLITAKRNTCQSGLLSAKAIRHFVQLLLAFATVPLASFLINLFPWWHLPFASFTSLLLIVLLAFLIGFSVWFVAERLVPDETYRTNTVPQMRVGIVAVAIIAMLTMLTLTIDVITGSRLHFSSIFGVQAQHAGRFYGFGNSGFVIFAISILVVTAFGLYLLRRVCAPNWQRFLFVLVMLSFAVFIDGAPLLGADFGGPPALVLAFIVLLLLHLGRRLNRRSILALAVLGLLGALSIAILDWFNPRGERTHLGDFIDSVLQGDFFLIVSRKFGEMFADISIYVWLIVAVVVAVAIWQAYRHGWCKVLPLNSDIRITGKVVVPADFVSCLVAIAVLLIFALLINDSGLLLPFIGLMYGIPLFFVIALDGYFLESR